jgi:hypothetical protein
MIESRTSRRARHAARMGSKRSAYRFLVAKPDGKRQLAAPSRRWEENIKMDLRGIKFNVWTGFIWLRTGMSGGIL